MKDIVYILYYITECTSIKQITLYVYGFMGLFVKVIELIINGKVPIYSWLFFSPGVGEYTEYASGFWIIPVKLFH